MPKNEKQKLEWWYRTVCWQALHWLFENVCFPEYKFTWNWMPQCCGQEESGLISSSSHEASCGLFVYSAILSIAMQLFSMSVNCCISQFCKTKLYHKINNIHKSVLLSSECQYFSLPYVYKSFISKEIVDVQECWWRWENT